MAAQLEDLDTKSSLADKSSKNFKEQVEELTDQLAEETRAKIAANNKQKQLQDELERLSAQLEDEEEAKDALQTKLVATNSQVGCNSLEVLWFALLRVRGVIFSRVC